MDFKDAIIWLATNFNIKHSVDLNNIQELTLEEQEEQKKLESQAILYEKAFEWMHNLLFEPEGKEALDYLINDRRYNTDALKNSEFCFFPEVQKVRDYLLQEFPDALEEIKSLSLNGFYRDNFRLAIPYRNKKKLITGFLKRATSPNGQTILIDQKTYSNIRWDSTAGLSKSDLFNLHNCREQETIIVLEGYPDAIYFTAIGMDNICAVGQGKLSKKYLESLSGTRIKHIILSFDNDAVGADNTEAAVKLILEESEIKPFVLDPTLLGAHKDPDEYVRANGIDAFKTLIKKAESGVNWVVNRKLRGYNPEDELNNEKILDKVIDFCDLVADSTELDKVVKQISDTFKYPKTSIKSKLKQKKKVAKPIKGDFWKINPETSEVDICMVEYKQFLEGRGIHKNFFGKEYMFLKNENNVVREFPEVRIKDLVINHIQNQDEKYKDSILEVMLNKTEKYFGTSFMECVKTKQVDFKRDKKIRLLFITEMDM